MLKFLRIMIALTALFSFSITAFATPLPGADDNVSQYYYYNWVTYTDKTTQANDATQDDVTWSSSGTDQMFIGSTAKFSRIYFDIYTAATSPTFPVSLDYSNGSGFTSYLTDGSPFGSTGVQYWEFTPPDGWAAQSVYESNSLYFIRLSGGGLAGAHVSQISVLSLGGGGGAPDMGPLMFMVTIGLGGLFIVKKVGTFAEAQRLA